MKIISFLLVVLFISCNQEPEQDETISATSHIGIYKSNKNSYRKDYILELNEDKAFIHGYSFMDTTKKDSIFFTIEYNYEINSKDEIRLDFNQITSTSSTKEFDDSFYINTYKDSQWEGIVKLKNTQLIVAPHLACSMIHNFEFMKQ